ncbi:unnamed protein product [Gongylonema pulchrum]|uniref:Uncharacterized protein n=1 Tax=Gongylonema pulchrum TaxID=637853 RepID=A0A3P7RDK2_9BILA|nr:unnamed protein product [Gongylonema pulchrum]
MRHGALKFSNSDKKRCPTFNQFFRDYESNQRAVEGSQECLNGQSVKDEEQCSGDSSDGDGGPTAVERSLAAMLGTEDNNNTSDDDSKNDAFLDRIFSDTGADDNGEQQTADISESNGEAEMAESSSDSRENLEKGLAAPNIHSD